MPWLQPETIKLASFILTSHEKAFGYKLFKHENTTNSNQINSKKLFSLNKIVLSHDNTNDPLINYSNALALKLWDKTWAEMIGMPSRLTAPKNEQKKRARVIKDALLKDFSIGYDGIRVSGKGVLFRIKNVRIWKIWDENSNEYGQAATFSDWDWV